MSVPPRNQISPLDWKTPIVNEDGTPTLQFLRLWQQLFGNEQGTNAIASGSAKAGDATKSGITLPSLTVVGNKEAVTGPVEDLTLTQILDFIGSAAQGDILYRGAANWARLPAGTSGNFLKTQGAGANPVWSSVPSGIPSMTLVQLHANLSVANSTFADLSWSASDIVSDSLGAWSSGSPNKFTCPSGMTKARITSCVYWASNSTGSRWNAVTNGTNYLNDDVRPAANEAGSSLVTPWFTGLTAGTSFFTFQYSQTSGGALNLIGGSGMVSATRVMIEWAP